MRYLTGHLLRLAMRYASSHASSLSQRSAAASRSRASRMRRNPPQNVMIHNNGEEHQKKHQSDLHKSLFKIHAQVAPHDPFNGQQQNISAIENGDRQQV